LKKYLRSIALCLAMVLMLGLTTSCGGGGTDGRTIIRIGHNQSENHPTHKGLTAFQEFINEKLGDRYDVQVYPSELLGSQTDMVQLTQTGAIDFVVASNAILETFNKTYEIFNLPYLFVSTEAYHHVMDDPDIVGPIFSATKESGFYGCTWIDAGTRNFYTKDTPINSPDDLKGLKIRVQQSPTNVMMMDLLGGSASPMGFGEVYTSLQAGIIDGAENNEMALVDNGHGEVCKFYSYDMHQMVPDILLVNAEFLDNLPADERAIFEEGFKIVNQVEREAWVDAVAEAKDYAENVQKVEFLYPDPAAFQEKCLPLHQTVLDNNPALQPVYDAIMEYNKEYPPQTDAAE
jgi:tripartite ATP-independent transporter DctP family solute receptor